MSPPLRRLLLCLAVALAASAALSEASAEPGSSAAARKTLRAALKLVRSQALRERIARFRLGEGREGQSE